MHILNILCMQWLLSGVQCLGRSCLLLHRGTPTVRQSRLVLGFSCCILGCESLNICNHTVPLTELKSQAESQTVSACFSRSTGLTCLPATTASCLWHEAERFFLSELQNFGANFQLCSNSAIVLSWLFSDTPKHFLGLLALGWSHSSTELIVIGNASQSHFAWS